MAHMRAISTLYRLSEKLELEGLLLLAHFKRRCGRSAWRRVRGNRHAYAGAVQLLQKPVRVDDWGPRGEAHERPRLFRPGRPGSRQ